VTRLAPLAGWIAFGLGLCLPLAAHAQGIASGAAQGAAGTLQAFFGGGCSGADCAITLVEYAVDRFQLLVIATGVFAVVRNGFTMIYSSNEDEQGRARKAIATTLASVMLAYLSPRFIVAFFTAGGEQGTLATPGGVAAGAAVVSAEVMGVLQWALTFFAVVTIVVVIVTGIRALTSPGDGGDRMKAMAVSIATACILLITAEAIKATFGITDFAPPGNPTVVPLIGRGVEIVQGILGLILIVALAVVVYAAFLMILSAGNQDMFSKGKSLIIRAGIGLVVILISYLLASFIVQILLG
jgi:hypothetical protein